jgi:hypothetical protein
MPHFRVPSIEPLDVREKSDSNNSSRNDQIEAVFIDDETKMMME